MKRNAFLLVASALAVLAVPAAAAARLTSRDATPAELIRRGDALMQQSRDALDPSRYAPAREAYEQALALEPQLPAAMLGLAWVFNSLHRFDDGAKWCHAALAVDVDLPDAYALLGDGAVEIGNYDGALQHFQRAVDLRPDLASYGRAAHLLWLTGHPERAQKLMRAAIAAGGAHPENSAWCAAQLALMCWEAGQLDEAESVLTTAFARGRDNPHLLHAASRVQMSRGDLAAAITSCQRSIAAAPTHEALADLADLYLAAGRGDEAFRQFSRVLEFQATQHAHGTPDSPVNDPAVPHFHGNTQLARFLADHRMNLDAAIGEAEAGVAAAPNVAAFDTLAWCYYQTGRSDEAKEKVLQALRWNTPSAVLYFHAGMIFAQSGDYVRAREHLDHALNLNPKFHPRFAGVAVSTLSSLR